MPLNAAAAGDGGGDRQGRANAVTKPHRFPARFRVLHRGVLRAGEHVLGVVVKVGVDRGSGPNDRHGAVGILANVGNAHLARNGRVPIAHAAADREEAEARKVGGGERLPNIARARRALQVEVRQRAGNVVDP